jgi:hypothetical protein
MCIENYRQSLFLLPFRNRYTPLERRVPYPLSPFCLRERNAATTRYARLYEDSPVRRRPQGRLPAREVESSRAFRSCQYSTPVWSQETRVGTPPPKPLQHTKIRH